MGGEIVTIDGRLARVLDLVPNPIAEAGESNLLEPTASSRSQFGPRQSSFLVTVEAVRSARAKNQPTEPHVSTIPLTKLKRDRLFFTKIAIRKFIREVAFKETRLHAPWIVKVPLKLIIVIMPAKYLIPGSNALIARNHKAAWFV